MEIWDTIAAERRQLADELATHTVPQELVEKVLSAQSDETVRNDYANRMAAPSQAGGARQ